MGKAYATHDDPELVRLQAQAATRTITITAVARAIKM